MHAYLITAKPNRHQKVLRAARVSTVAALIGTGMVLLALIVFLLRVARLITNLAATWAAKGEYAASAKVGIPPLGATLGYAMADAFTEEFTRVYAEAA
jgi:hypothetical protein